MSKVDNRKADGEDMRYLKQPRGPGTSWVFRFVPPAHLVGLPNPWDGKPIRETIARGLKTRHLPTARKRRDQLLGDVLIRRIGSVQNPGGVSPIDFGDGRVVAVFEIGLDGEPALVTTYPLGRP